MKGITVFLVVSVLLCSGILIASATEWSQWRGPNRDGISDEVNLLKEWSPKGPKVLWKIPLGEGFSGISVSQGRAYTMFSKGDDEFVVCLDATDGGEIWRFRSDKNYHEGQGGNGPRATPTIDGDLLFTISAHGKLYALNAASGQKVWSHDLQRKFGSKMPRWGFTASPLVEGELLLVEVGGKGEKSIVAFNKNSGDVIWSSHKDKLGYSSPIAITVKGVRQIICFTGTKLVSVSPTDGTIYWQYPWKTGYDVNAATPVFIPPDKVFISSGYDKGAAVVQMRVFLSPDDDRTATEQIGENRGIVRIKEIWKNRKMKNQFASSVLHENYLYGFDNSILKCIEADTGEEQWKSRGYGKGTLILADGHLIILSDKGKLGLAEATPAGYIGKASAKVLSGLCWTAPTLANGKLYVRNEEEIICLDMTGEY
ncbi:PQQ-binding-like beta-propeller repeat protein [Candidatus Poribacteria bacterium]|nr:PQQ-binding-like beta-propeller repeat protein [Candidatus Poribacteria bacterium]